MQESQSMELTAGKIVRVTGDIKKTKDEEMKERLNDSYATDELLKIPEETEDPSTGINKKGEKLDKSFLCKYIIWGLIVFFILGNEHIISVPGVGDFFAPRLVAPTANRFV